MCGWSDDPGFGTLYFDKIMTIIKDMPYESMKKEYTSAATYANELYSCILAYNPSIPGPIKSLFDEHFVYACSVRFEQKKEPPYIEIAEGVRNSLQSSQNRLDFKAKQYYSSFTIHFL